MLNEVTQTSTTSLDLLSAEIDFTYHQPPTPMHVIDDPNTRLHDDAIGWRDTGDGYLVYTAIAAAGLVTDFDTHRLPDSYHLRLPRQQRQNANLTGTREAVILTYFTQNGSIERPRLSFGLISSNQYNHQTLPDTIRQELFRITNQPSSQASIQYFMSNYNTIIANTAAKAGLSIPFTTSSKTHLSSEPRTTDLYAPATNPLRKELDLVTNHQLTKYLSRRGKPLAASTIRKYLKAYKNKTAA